MARQLSDLRKLQKHQLNKINKDDLIESILSSEDLDISDKLSSVTKELNELKSALLSPDSPVNKRITELEVKVDRQAQVIAAQQQFLEAVDRREREANLVILGVPDQNESLDGATTDGDKLNIIWRKIGVPLGIEGTHRRLGRDTNEDGMPKRRPILLVLADKNKRSGILEKSKQLKTAEDNYKKIFIKKDVHPCVRKEWKRLRDVEKAEKERPENVGCVINLDTRERKLYKDGVVIDGWSPLIF